MKTRMRLLAFVLMASSATLQAQTSNDRNIGKVKVVSQLKIRPGCVAVSKYGRIFSTTHPLGNHPVQLIEITGPSSYISFPSDNYQKDKGVTASDEKFDSPLGLVFDSHDRLWTIDMGIELGRTRLWCFNIRNKKLLEKITLPEDIAPKGSNLKDLVIDDQNGWAYLSDIKNPAIIAINLETKQARRFDNHSSLKAENLDMVIDGKTIQFAGKPIRIGINPITLSPDNETLYFGAMNGETWYQVPTKYFREGANDETIGSKISVNGKKPISDGACTSASGNHYFTDLQNHGIAKLSEGVLSSIVRDDRLQWPQSIHLGPDQCLYISVNQLHTTAAFTGQADEGQPPYYILKVYTGEDRVNYASK